MDILLPKRYDKRGGPLWIITHLLSHFYNDIKCIEYSGQKSGIFLGYNTIPREVISKKGIRKILLVGGCKMKENGIPRKERWKDIDVVVFNSHFSKRVTTSSYRVGKHSVIYILGGAPSDPRIHTPLSKASNKFNKDEIHFMTIAKWWKRPFKRLKQTEKLFSNYILKKYPKAKLHVGGVLSDNCNKKNIYYYKKTFHRDTVPNLYKKCDIQLMFSTFDTGPMTLTESMHYRVPFVCSNNCCGKELISRVDGDCGISIDTDPEIKTYKDCKKIRPMTNKKFYSKDIDYGNIMRGIKTLVNNYNHYISWEWTNSFSYEAQAKKWRNILLGNSS